MIRRPRLFLALVLCVLIGYLPAGSASQSNPAEGFLDTLARDTWAYLHADQATAHHLPYSGWSASLPGGDYANPAEIGLYALSWLAAYDLARPWSPSWSATEAELHAILDQLRAWQTGSQAYLEENTHETVSKHMAGSLAAVRFDRTGYIDPDYNCSLGATRSTTG